VAGFKLPLNSLPLPCNSGPVSILAPKCSSVMSVSSSSSAISLPTVPVSSLQLQSVKVQPSSPSSPSSVTSPKVNQFVVNRKSSPQRSPPKSAASISLLSPTRTLNPVPVSSISSPRSEGIKLLTADGKMINAEGLQLMSPNGTLIKAENLIQNMSFKPKPPTVPMGSPAPTAQKIVTELNAQHLISSIQQPVPLTPKVPPSSVLSGAGPASSPPSSILKHPPHSPPLLPVIPGLKLPTSPDKDMMRSAKTETVKDPMLTQTVSPSKILPPPVSFASTNIHNLLPTQPLLPSEISNIKHPVAAVAKPLNFTSKDGKPSRPRSKTGITLREVEVQQVVGLETKQVTMIGKEKEEEEEEMVMMMAEIRNKDLLQNNKILINIHKI